MGIEGKTKIEFLLQDDGRVVRRVSGFYGQDFIPTSAKSVADSVKEFRERFPNARIANMREVEVAAKPAPVRSVEDVVAEMSDAELAKLGLSRKVEPTGTAIPKEFPGDFALRRAGITVETLATLTRDDLIKVDGIGEKLADKIIAARDGGKVEE